MDRYLEDIFFNIHEGKSVAVFHNARKRLSILRMNQLEVACTKQEESNVQRIALSVCHMQGYMRGEGADWLKETTVEGGVETPLAEKCALGDAHAAGFGCARRSDGVCPNGWTPLRMAAYGGKTGTTQLLLRAGAQVDKALRDGSTALHLAAPQGHADVIRVLVEAGAQVQAQQQGFTALHLAAQKGHAYVF